MVKLKKIKALSAAKMCGLIGFVLGIIAAIVGFLGFGINFGLQVFSGQEFDLLTMLSGLLLTIFAPVIYAVLGIVMGALVAFLYNVFAGIAGGIEIELE